MPGMMTGIGQQIASGTTGQDEARRVQEWTQHSAEREKAMHDQMNASTKDHSDMLKSGPKDFMSAGAGDNIGTGNIG